MFVFRQLKAVADVLQCTDDDDNGNSSFLSFSEGKADGQSLETQSKLCCEDAELNCELLVSWASE
jgi:hypothetical protein